MRRAHVFIAIVALVSVVTPSPASAATPSDCWSLARHGRRAEALACYQSLTATADPYFRAEGFWGLEQYQDANSAFRAAIAAAEGNALYRVRWGRLLHERFNNGDAADLFNEALKRDPKNADAYVGLALVGADGVDTRVDDPIAKALELNPTLVEAHEVAANMALEASNPEDA